MDEPPRTTHVVDGLASSFPHSRSVCGVRLANGDAHVRDPQVWLEVDAEVQLSRITCERCRATLAQRLLEAACG